MDNGLVVDGVPEEKQQEPVVTNTQLVKIDNLNADQVMKQVNDIQDVLKKVMKDGEHYGLIPGVKKKILMKPGAEKIGLTFRLNPKYEVERIDHQDFHREYIVTCSLYHISGNFVGQGVGSCSTLESKYRYRNDYEKQEKVPKSYWNNRDAEAWKGRITKKFDDGWYFVLKGDRIENPDLADQYNTILKMAKKRAHVDAILTATAASDIFTQDLDEGSKGGEKTTKKKPDQPAPAPPVQNNYAEIMKLLNNGQYSTDQRRQYKSRADACKNNQEQLAKLKDEIEDNSVTF